MKRLLFCLLVILILSSCGEDSKQQISGSPDAASFSSSSTADSFAPGSRGKGLTSTKKSKTPEYVPGEVLVKFRTGTSENTIHSLHNSIKAAKIKEIKHIGVQHIKLKDISVEDAVKFYKADPNVEYAEPNYILKLAAIPDDTFFTNLWGLDNTGQTVDGTAGTADADIDAPEAWGITTGSSNVQLLIT